MTVRVLLFGPLAEAVGRSSVDVPLDGDRSCAAVKSRIAHEWQALRLHMPVCRLAVNRRFAAEGDAVRPGDEVALIGLVSGG